MMKLNDFESNENVYKTGQQGKRQEAFSKSTWVATAIMKHIVVNTLCNLFVFVFKEKH